MNKPNEMNGTNEIGGTGDDEMRSEYGPEFWKGAERGKYYYKTRRAALQKELENSALLAPDVRAAFPTDAAVNDALRHLMHKASQEETTPHEDAASVGV